MIIPQHVWEALYPDRSRHGLYRTEEAAWQEVAHPAVSRQESDYAVREVVLPVVYAVVNSGDRYILGLYASWESAEAGRNAMEYPDNEESEIEIQELQS